MKGLYALLVVVIIGGLVGLAALWLSSSLCGVNCGDKDARRDLGVVVFFALVLALLLLIKSQSRKKNDA